MKPKYKNHIKMEAVNKLTPFELGWISALLDGEGSISMVRQKECSRPHRKSGYSIQPRIYITNKNLAILQKTKEIIGMGCISKCNTKFCYEYQLRGLNRIYTLIKQIEPYLIIKKRRAHIVLQFCESRFIRLENKARCLYSAEEIEMATAIKQENIVSRNGKWEIVEGY